MPNIYFFVILRRLFTLENYASYHGYLLQKATKRNIYGNSLDIFLLQISSLNELKLTSGIRCIHNNAIYGDYLYPSQ